MWHSSNGFLTIIWYVIIPDGRLRETENKRTCRISGLKGGRGRLRNLSSGCLRESYWNRIWPKKKPVIFKVAAYGRWSLTESWLSYTDLVWLVCYAPRNSLQYVKFINCCCTHWCCLLTAKLKVYSSSVEVQYKLVTFTVSVKDCFQFSIHLGC